MTTEIEKILQMNEFGQSVNLRFFSRINIDMRVEIFEYHKKIFYRLKQVHKNKSHAVLSYCAFILSIQKFVNELEKMDLKDYENLSLEDIKKISQKKANLFLIKKSRKKTKRDKLIGYWAIVKSLKNDEKFSFRQISEYLKKYHKFEVGHTLIYTLWKEFENENINI